MIAKTQQFKSISLREIIGNALKGKPINVNTHPLFDLDDTNIDDDDMIVDEFSDPLEYHGYLIERNEIRNDIRLAEEKEQREKEQKEKEKGGIKDETQKTPPSDEKTPPLSQE